MTLAMLVTAALSYTVGGVFMKASDGLARPLPSLLAFGVIGLGVAAHALAMRQADLSAAYLFVLGLECALVVAFGFVMFHEHYSPVRVGGLVFVLLGLVLLQLSEKA